MNETLEIARRIKEREARLDELENQIRNLPDHTEERLDLRRILLDIVKELR